LYNFHLTLILEFVRIEKSGRNMLSHITLNIDYFYLCNTYHIIFIDNYGVFAVSKPYDFLDVISHVIAKAHSHVALYNVIVCE
jgi:hypothetical protein